VPAPSTAPELNRVERWLRAVEAERRRPVAERVPELLDGIRRGAGRLAGETWDHANERLVEEFIAELKRDFRARVFEAVDRASLADAKPLVDEERLLGDDDQVPRLADAGPQLIIERQTLKPMARRTTGFNYIFTVPGDSPERLILIAHYDTWRGPGADDNTTGEEICKQYLRDDLRQERRPRLTHTYILAGSEECGLIGFTSQVLLALGLGLANMALAKGIYVITALGIAMVPLAKFRFGVSGSREYVQSLSTREMALIKSVISVDSVGEGKMYIPESSLGADFVRAFIPFAGYASLNSLLQEGAHLNGIRYNSFIAGGTTDHVSFLEVNSGFRDMLGDWLGCPRWLGCHRTGKRKIPAAALVALCPGKASPMVFGGKIHTANDTADRVYPGPLAESLRIIDYWYHIMHGGERMAAPRDVGEYHYAQLFAVEVPQPGAASRREHWLALKDAIEPNRRNINGLYRVTAEVHGDKAVCRDLELLDWGVHTRLHHQVEDRLGDAGGSYERVPVTELRALTDGRELVFKRRAGFLRRTIVAAARGALGRFERFMGSNTFLTFFGAAYLLAKVVDIVLMNAFASSMMFQEWFFRWFVIMLPLTVALQLWAVLWLIGKKIPTMIDNAYKHLNRSDNLRSLARA
jgi:hypothetical protein